MLAALTPLAANAQVPAAGTTVYAPIINEDTNPYSKKNICLGECMYKVYTGQNDRMNEITKKIHADPSWKDSQLNAEQKQRAYTETMRSYVPSAQEFYRQQTMCENSCKNIR